VASSRDAKQSAVKTTRKLSYRKDDRAMRPMYGCPENFRVSLSTLTAAFPDRSYECVYKSSFIRSPWDSRGYPKNQAVPGYAHAPMWS